MYNIYKIVDGEQKEIGAFEKFEEAATAVDIYRSVFSDNSELIIRRDGNEN